MSETMAIDWDAPAKERDCPLCGTETEVEDKDVGRHSKQRVRECPGCGWMIHKGGRWKSPRDVEPGWWANL